MNPIVARTDAMSAPPWMPRQSARDGGGRKAAVVRPCRIAERRLRGREKEAVLFVNKKNQKNVLSAPRGGRTPLVSLLWDALGIGDFAHAIETQVRRFNGVFFKNRTVLPLRRRHRAMKPKQSTGRVVRLLWTASASPPQ
ncbi:MAG: hypothetical protein NT133_10590 [Alphaproteobacteria bacterium]|nr:hypothetical protein [Alphaproteobacteria bacterium]